MCSWLHVCVYSPNTIHTPTHTKYKWSNRRHSCWLWIKCNDILWFSSEIPCFIYMYLGKKENQTSISEWYIGGSRNDVIATALSSAHTLPLVHHACPWGDNPLCCPCSLEKQHGFLNSLKFTMACESLSSWSSSDQSAKLRLFSSMLSVTNRIQIHKKTASYLWNFSFTAVDLSSEEYFKRRK